jgi:pyruvate,water dikinase
VEPYTLSFDELDGARLPELGGKGANLGELTREGFPSPPGFCVTTTAAGEASPYQAWQHREPAATSPATAP